MDKGTPKTLKEAIQNGLEPVEYRHEDLQRIEAHVRDFLAQKFTPDLMEDPKVQNLWQEITKPEFPRTAAEYNLMIQDLILNSYFKKGAS
jgi:hypothetical protein